MTLITYATNQLKNSTDMKLKQLVAAMLNDGAAAQNYFGHNTDKLANASLAEEQKLLPGATSIYGYHTKQYFSS